MERVNGSTREGRGVLGMQFWHGTAMVQGSHECGKHGCALPAQVAVFGKRTATALEIARLNCCRMHVAEAMRSLEHTWMCALPGSRERGEYCPHCAARTVDANGRGHLKVCPIGLTFPDNARDLGVARGTHDVSDCEVCMSYAANIPGPAG